jgi:tRNA dimethylallyltransferase
MQKIIVILGPTASGKTHLAIQLAKKFNGEIVSADSRQIYRGLDIGTAKPTKKEMLEVPHHLIDIVTPNKTFTVSQYKNRAIKIITSILKRNKVPFLVGGTGLYIKAVIDNLDIPKVKPDIKLRKRLESKMRIKGLKSLYDQLIKIDPEAAYIVDQQNPRRIIRALEVALKTKKPFSQQYKKKRPLFDTLQIGLNPGKDKLKEKIEKRVDKMIKNGLVLEVKKLIAKYNKNLAVFDAIGYREIIDYLQKKLTLAQAVEKIKKNTVKYAKRQMTWFKKDTRIHWIKTKREAEKLIKSFLEIKEGDQRV